MLRIGGRHASRSARFAPRAHWSGAAVPATRSFLAPRLATRLLAAALPRVAVTFRAMGGAAAEPPTGPKNTGGAPGRMSEEKEQATAKELEELEAEEEGAERFESGALQGPFGVMEDPVKVPSTHNSRFVGCLGGEGELSHELLWMEVFRGRKHACPRCGQVFMLVDKDADLSPVDEIELPDEPEPAPGEEEEDFDTSIVTNQTEEREEEAGEEFDPDMDEEDEVEGEEEEEFDEEFDEQAELEAEEKEKANAEGQQPPSQQPPK